MVYVKKGQFLEESDRFVYKEELYLDYPNRWELFRSKLYTSKTLVYKKDSRSYNKNLACYIQRCWELIAAPKQFLIKEGFKCK